MDCLYIGNTSGQHLLTFGGVKINIYTASGWLDLAQGAEFTKL